MASANKVILLGHLGFPPELKYTSGGTAVCSMRLATNHVYKDREGNKQEHTNWIRLKSFGRQAEVCKEYLDKGRQIYVEGRLHTDSYEDSRGVKRTKAEVITNQVVFLSDGRRGRDSLAEQSGSHAAEPAASFAAPRQALAQPVQQAAAQPVQQAAAQPAPAVFEPAPEPLPDDDIPF